MFAKSIGNNFDNCSIINFKSAYRIKNKDMNSTLADVTITSIKKPHEVPLMPPSTTPDRWDSGF